MSQMVKKGHYVSNQKFYEALVNYRQLYREAKHRGDPLPQIPNYIGECLMLIANRLSNKPNFIGYPHRDEMISDGIETCIKYIMVFNPEKSKNPFAFFTQTIKNSFIRRIKFERKQLYLKFKASQNQQLTECLNDNKFIIQNNELINSFIKDYEDSIARRREEAIGLEKAIQNDKDQD